MDIPSVSDENPGTLVARDPSDKFKDFLHRIASANETVGPNGARFIRFDDDGPLSIGSLGFNSNIGLIISSTAGAIAGHFSQEVDSVDIASDLFNDLYEENEEFLNNALPIVYGQVEEDEETWTSPILIEEFAAIVEGLTGNTATYVRYLEAQDTWVDQDGTSLNDEEYHDIRSGGFLAESTGDTDSDATTQATFITSRLQKEVLQADNKS